MGSRGRRSRAEQETKDTRSALVRTERPPPPQELTGEYAREWKEIVDALPGDRLTREKEPLLVALCRHRVALRHIGQIIDKLEAQKQLDVERYDTALNMQIRESRIIASLSVRLGFGDSTARPKKDGLAGRKPWHFQPESEPETQ